MTLATRLSAFFLAVQGLILAGFSATLYLLAADHLSRQVDDRLDASLTALSAAAEVETDGVAWEPKEREQGLGRDAGPDQIHWVVFDARGLPVDHSANLRPWRELPAVRPDHDAARFLGPDGRHWRARSRRLSAAGTDGETVGATAAESPPSRGTDRDPGGSALTIAVFAPLGPTEAILSRLALTLIALSVTLWLAATLIGRRLCRSALAPLATMAEAAIEADAEDPETRLPVPGTGDELEDMGKAFNGLLDRLHESLERQRRFTGDASHQLRTPLAGLLTHVDVALRRERPAAEYHRVLGIVRAKAVLLRQIVESLLFLARAESEAGRPDLEVVDLARWIPEHLHDWSSHPRAGDIRAELADTDRLRIRAHPPLLSQLVDNLLENACAYSDPSTPIVVRAHRGPGVTVLTVEDRGVGLSAEDQSRIFEPFYRTPQARQRGHAGVGLGLAVARRIAAVFGGRIGVETESGIGSRFAVVLPAGDPPGESEPPPVIDRDAPLATSTIAGE